MKNVSLLAFIALVVITLVNNNVSGQTSAPGEAYFLGKWDLMVRGLPQGDSKMFLNLEKTEGNVIGKIGDPAVAEATMDLSNIQISDSTLTATFYAQGYDVTISLTKKDNQRLTGNMMGMFDIEGTKQ
ncbi:MAG: hypothetical protein JXB49_25970 [Bacteroidales bacterium]|nr:hypothetical protein [Bacteroidales bacterium]